MQMNITIPNTLNKGNIDATIQVYRDALNTMDCGISGNNIVNSLTKLKHQKMPNGGPYRGIALAEAANRIMTDLVILYGVKDLLDGKHPQIDFPEYAVECGTVHKNAHNVMADTRCQKMEG
jgi:hypothetical protein